MRLVVGISGASGAVFAIRLLEALRDENVEVHLVVSKWAQQTIEHETGRSLADIRALAAHHYPAADLGAAISSGSFVTEGMVIVPCSMRSVAAIAHGTSENLVHRAADVALKERRRLVIVPRETPLSPVHLENLLRRVDAMTMATAVEARVPFVDHQLVEFAMAMPLKYKLRWRSPFHRARALLSYSDVFAERDDTTKFILRRAFDDLLPPEIVRRKKVGFKVPLEHSLGDRLLAVARELLLGDEARRRGVLDVDAVARWLDRGPANGGEFGHRVWMLLNLELWFRRYFPDGRVLGYPTPSPAAASR